MLTRRLPPEGGTTNGTMRVFVSEYVCGGGWPESEIAGPLAQEGRAMLCAVVADLARIAGVRVTTTWDVRLGPAPFENAHVIVVESPVDELPVFHELARVCDATLVIAPELGGELARRTQLVESVDGRLLGSDSRSVEVCTDKHGLWRLLDEAGIPAIRTEDFSFALRRGSNRPAFAAAGPATSLCFPIVVKPNDGAGSQSIWLIRDLDELARLRPVLEADVWLKNAVWQPFVAGLAVSVAVLISADGSGFVACPPAEQRLSADGRFHYLGGRIPAREVDVGAIQRVAANACAAVPGLRGYVGVDLVVPESNPGNPMVVEINPRLTTSYIGLRQLAEDNLAEWLLPGNRPRALHWREGAVTFAATPGCTDLYATGACERR